MGRRTLLVSTDLSRGVRMAHKYAVAGHFGKYGCRIAADFSLAVLSNGVYLLVTLQRGLDDKILIFI